MIQLVITFIIALVFVAVMAGGFEKVDEGSLIMIPFLMLYQFAVLFLFQNYKMGDNETMWMVIVCRCIVYPPLVLIVVAICAVLIKAIYETIRDTIKEIKRKERKDVQRIAWELAMEKIKQAKIRAKIERREKRAMIKKQLIESGLFYEYDPWEILEEDDEDDDCDNMI